MELSKLTVMVREFDIVIVKLVEQEYCSAVTFGDNSLLIFVEGVSVHMSQVLGKVRD